MIFEEFIEKKKNYYLLKNFIPMNLLISSLYLKNIFLYNSFLNLNIRKNIPKLIISNSKFTYFYSNFLFSNSFEDLNLKNLNFQNFLSTSIIVKFHESKTIYIERPIINFKFNISNSIFLNLSTLQTGGAFYISNLNLSVKNY